MVATLTARETEEGGDPREDEVKQNQGHPVPHGANEDHDPHEDVAGPEEAGPEEAGSEEAGPKEAGPDATDWTAAPQARWRKAPLTRWTAVKIAPMNALIAQVASQNLS